MMAGSWFWHLTPPVSPLSSGSFLSNTITILPCRTTRTLAPVPRHYRTCCAAFTDCFRIHPTTSFCIHRHQPTHVPASLVIGRLCLKTTIGISNWSRASIRSPALNGAVVFISTLYLLRTRHIFCAVPIQTSAFELLNLWPYKWSINQDVAAP